MRVAPILLTAFLGVVQTTVADELEKILKRPPSAGAITLLTKYPKDPRVAERLAAAVRSPDAVTRAVAARVVNLAVLPAPLPDIAAALAAETDVDAAREQVRTLVSVGGTAYDAPVLAAARRLAPRLDRQLVRMFARSRGFDAIPLYLETLRHLALSARDREAFFRIATRGSQPQLVATAARAFGRNDAESFQAILAVAAELGHDLDRPVMIEALRSGALTIRGEAAWYLARIYSKEPPADRGAFLAALSEPARPPDADPELRFGAEMLRRVLGETPVEDEGWIACLETNPECHLDSDFGELPLVRFLTPRERAAVERRNRSKEPQETGWQGPTPPKLKPDQELRLVSGLPRGLAHDLFRIEGCRSGRYLSYNYGFASLQFRPDGLPRNVSLLALPPGEACKRAAQSLFLMALAPNDEHFAAETALIHAVSLNADEMACNEGSTLDWQPGDEAKPSVRRVRGEVKSPRLVKKIEPSYPLEARKNRESGASIFEAIISTNGCVRELRLVKSSTVMLDVAALQALSQWRYKPATLDGKPVSVYLTVTVTFRLHV